MELEKSTVELITKGEFAKATFDFQSFLKDKYSKLKEVLKKEYKVYEQ
jgi:hypothetical protein